MRFQYQGYDRAAKKVSGALEAKTEGEARAILRSQSIRPVKIGIEKDGSGGGFNINDMFSSPKPTLMEFTAFIRQLATMQGAGIPIVQALGVLAEQVDNKGFGNALRNIQKQIEEGTTLTAAMRRYPKIFDKVFLNLVAAGEVSGALDKVLIRLAIFYEKAAGLQRKVKSAMTYPVLICIIVTVVVLVLLTFVVPTFANMFAQNGKALPAPTQIIMNISNFVRSYWYLIFGGLGGSVFGIITAYGNEQVRRVIDPYMMELPIFGDLFKKIAIARFSRTLGTMIQSGVPILDALEITANVAGNFAVEDVIKRTRLSITEGNSLAAPLSASRVFPKMAVSMIAIGEQTGALDQMLTKIAEFYEDEVDAKVGALTSILEPLMIAIVGIVVASVLIPMYLPIFSMADAMGG